MKNEKIRWMTEDELLLTRLEYARDGAREANRYPNGDYERLQELKEKRRKSRQKSST